MSHTALGALALAAGLLTGCYRDDTRILAPDGSGRARVLLTDAPFPYDSVASVDLYITRIDASASLDTSGGGTWTTIVAPRRRFNLVALQQGNTALLGEGQLAAGNYRAVRMVIDTDSSGIRWSNGTAAVVNWQSGGGGAEQALHALVEAPVPVAGTGSAGAEIVLDVDVGRSFLFDFFGAREFTFIPWIRAVHTAITGSIEGSVTRTSPAGGVTPVKNANITVVRGDSSLAATGRTDANGFYRVAFLREGSYRVRVEQPEIPELAAAVSSGIAVSAGQSATYNVLLPAAGGGGAYVRVTGPASVGVGGTIALHAAVGDANGETVINPTIVWTVSDTGIAALADSGAAALVTGKRAGTVLVAATSGGLADTLAIAVVGSTAPVGSVAVSPATRTLSAADSAQSYATFTAVLRDSAGNQLFNRPITWQSSDTSVVAVLFGQDAQVYVRALRAGSATISATSEGKAGQAAVTVTP
jgi:hypothetical protein